MPDVETRQRLGQRLAELYERHRELDERGVVNCYRPGRGFYVPQPDSPERTEFAIAVATTDGAIYAVGDHALPFAQQSLSKVFAYGLVLDDHGRDYVMRRVGVEPSGDAFYSIVFDERNNRPYNPMVNAGAIVVSNLVRGASPDEKLERLLAVFRRYAGNDDLGVDPDILRAELGAADRNRAIAYLMRSQGMITGDAEATLRLYLEQCSVRVTCRDVAVMAATLANGGVNPLTGVRALGRRSVRDVLSVMYTCGMYDAAGAWACDVGVPAKSGVSGGLMCVIPGKMGVCVFSPPLDAYGNSARGVSVCREMSERLGLHVFATEAEDAMLGEAPAPAQPVAGTS